jgi:cardiolipin synthase
MPDWLVTSWYWFSGPAVLVMDLAATAHVILRKRDTRAAIGWVGLIWLVPVLGPVLYYSLGINRIARKARRLKGRRAGRGEPPLRLSNDPPLPLAAGHLVPLARLVHGVTAAPLLPGNTVRPLTTGTEAYGEMLAAIDAAEKTLGLSTYIFDKDAAGEKFLAALTRAAGRGVDVRVLIDDVGARYSWPHTIVRPLRQGGVKVAKFLPQLVPWHFAYANLRNHRKILVVDGTLGFTGGMNIRAGHDASLNPTHPIIDMHFRIEGPVVGHLRETFADDWEFAAGNRPAGPTWFPNLGEKGTIVARGIRGGPDDDDERIRAVILGALAVARDSVRVVTPYFLPDGPLIAGLDGAALRGVTVDVVLPAKNNLRLVQWACQGQLGQVLDHGVRVWFAPPPFAHTKLLIVDRVWVLLGSSNWDPRSLRLNFEFDVECYDPDLAQRLDDRTQETVSRSRRVTKEWLTGRNILLRLRDGAARLLTPYL